MGKNTALVLVGLAVVCAGMVLCIVGLATTYWMVLVYVDKDWHAGLFVICQEENCISHLQSPIFSGFGTTAAGLIIGIIAAGTAILFGVIHLVIRLCAIATWNFVIFVFVKSILGGIAVLTGLIIFYASDRHEVHEIYHNKMDYSFYLSLAGGIAMLIGGVVVLTGRGKTQAANVVVLAPPQHNVVAMQNTREYGYDQGQFNPSPPSLPTSF